MAAIFKMATIGVIKKGHLTYIIIIIFTTEVWQYVNCIFLY